MTGDLVARLVERRNEFELDVTLEVPAGQTLALVGPNGAGKTSVLDLIAGRRPLSAPVGADGPAGSTPHIRLGDTLLDEPATDRFVPPERRRIGVVDQHHLLFDHLSVLDNVAFGPRASGRSRREAHRDAGELLALLGLADLAERRPTELSGGQAQRVAIARALATRPALLLLDEPLAALDVATRIEVRRLLVDRLSAFAGPAIYVGHDPVDALLLADRVAVIEDGRLTQAGTPDEIRSRPATRYAAALVGTNLLLGRADRGVVHLDTSTGPHELRIADGDLDGPVLCAVRPEAISLHVERPSGSQRNIWSTTVEVVEPTGDTTRITVGAPVALAVDVTSSAVEQLGITVGTSVYVAVKATEITARPA